MLRMNNSRNKIKLKPMKNVDSVQRTLHIRAFCIPFPLLGIAGFIFGDITGLFLAKVLMISMMPRNVL